MDLSPTAKPTLPFTNLNVSRIRDRPEWGEIFSPHWLACRPTLEEMITIGEEAASVLTNYLPTLGEIGNTSDIIAGQNNYCLQQQRNEHTRKALTNILGAKGADNYMSTILFPTIDITSSLST
jgi:phycocyanobilin:ferredoxin oxidoreductase